MTVAGTSICARARRTELAAVRFEAFSVAWLHHVPDKYAPYQTAFTKHYLKHRGRKDIWEAMPPYNRAVSHSGALGRDSTTAAGRAYLGFLDELRFGMLKAWHARGYEMEAAVRTANRLGTEVAWKQRLTPSLMATTLSRAVGVDPSEEAHLRTTAIIIGLCDGATGAIKGVNIHADC